MSFFVCATVNGDDDGTTLNKPLKFKSDLACPAKWTDLMDILSYAT